MGTHLLLTKDTCKNCKNEFVSSDRWIKSICPSCVIQGLEDSTDMEWMANMDPPAMNIESYNKINADDLYHVVIDKNHRYRLVNHRSFMMRRWKFGKIYFTHELKNCVEWIKKRK